MVLNTLKFMICSILTFPCLSAWIFDSINLETGERMKTLILYFIMRIRLDRIDINNGLSNVDFERTWENGGIHKHPIIIFCISLRERRN